uniref:Uncharacterized protein n=1 Tax=Sphaerodactylus townsendi TaxID=933632 RepID=A0ACB8F618_9SAUR
MFCSKCVGDNNPGVLRHFPSPLKHGMENKEYYYHGPNLLVFSILTLNSVLPSRDRARSVISSCPQESRKQIKINESFSETEIRCSPNGIRREWSVFGYIPQF